MKQLLLLITLLVSGLSFAQSLPSASGANKIVSSVSSAATPPTINKSSSSLMLTDTLIPAILAADCAASNVGLFSAEGGGFVLGSNSFFDFEKLQRIILPEAVDFTLTEVLIGIVADSVIGDKPLVVKIYPEITADSVLLDPVGFSDTLLVSETNALNDSVFFTSFTFSDPVELDSTASFLVSLDVSGVYFNPDGSVDTLNTGHVGIFSTPENCGDGRNVLELFPNTEGGLTLSNVLTSWDLNTEMYMLPVVIRDFFSSTRMRTTDFSAVAFPNPVQDRLTVSFAAPVAGDYQLRVVSVNGAVIRQRTVSTPRGTATAELGVTDLPAGIYLFQVEGAQGVQTGRLVKR